MLFDIPLPAPYSVHQTPDGYMVCGPHAQTAQENLDGGTVSSIYLIVHQGQACVVDTGRFDAAYHALAGMLKQLGHRLRYIILTHDHYDHVGNAERLRSEFGGEIIAHALDRPLIVDPLSLYDAETMRRCYGADLHEAWNDLGIAPDGVARMRQGTATHFNVPVHVDTYVDQETTLALAGLELRLLHTPGHSPGSLSVHVPATGTVYTGDLTFWVNPCRPYPIGNALDCVRSLERIRALAPRYCGHGHYQGVNEPDGWLKKCIASHHQLRDNILAQLDTPRTIPQLREAIFPEDPFDSFPLIPENSIHAWLMALVHTKQVTRQAGEGQPAVWRSVR